MTSLDNPDKVRSYLGGGPLRHMFRTRHQFDDSWRSLYKVVNELDRMYFGETLIGL